MKLILTGLLLFSVFAQAQCPSIDETIAARDRGQATNIDVESAILCKYSNCDLKILFLTNNLTYTVDRFNVGELTRAEITDAATKLAQAKMECSKR